MGNREEEVAGAEITTEEPEKSVAPSDDKGSEGGSKSSNEGTRTAASADRIVPADSRPGSVATLEPDVVSLAVENLEIVGTPEDRFALGETIYGLPLKMRAIIMAVLVAIGLVSIFVVSPIFSDPETYTQISQTLDEKKSNVLALTAAATGASTAISLVPGDAGSPIASKLADLSVGFLIILVAIFLEKYLLTVIGFVMFSILVPLCCGLWIAALALGTYKVTRTACAHLAVRLIVVGAAFCLLVPCSVGVSNMIDATYEQSINQTIQVAQDSSAQVQEVVAESDGETTESEGSGNVVWDWISDRLQDAQEAAGAVIDAVTNSVANVTQWFQGILNNFIEAMAVMLVTSCIIPILVLILFLFVIKAIFNVDISKPMEMLDPRTYRKSKTRDAKSSKRIAAAKEK